MIIGLNVSEAYQSEGGSVRWLCCGRPYTGLTLIIHSMTGVTDMIDNAVHTLAFMAGLTVLLLAVLVLIDHGTLRAFAQ